MYVCGGEGWCFFVLYVCRINYLPRAYKMPYQYKKEIDVITDMYSKLSDLPIDLMKPALKSVSTLIRGQYPDISN